MRWFQFRVGFEAIEAMPPRVDELARKLLTILVVCEEPMADEEKRDEPALHGEVLALKKRIEVLESRVTELERELRETQETAPSD